ncbi:hypothetical protein [Streptomyces collinus]|uniref:hypothetical protein n=1 Tax=Streptomyces collinus TaxID=42684 RepID=UPI0036A33BB8
MSLRTRTETEIETIRQQRANLDKNDTRETGARHEGASSPESQQQYVRELLRLPSDGVAGQLMMISAEDGLPHELIAQVKRDGEPRKQELKSLLAGLLRDEAVQQETGAPPPRATPGPDADPAPADVRAMDMPEDSERNPDAWDLQAQRFQPLIPQWLGTVRTTLDGDGPEARWRRMRDCAGQPSIRELATSTGLTFGTISRLLGGTSDHTQSADRLLLELEKRARSIDLWLQDMPPGSE